MILTSDISLEESACIVAETLAKGKLAIIPTDTIYGISGIVPSAEKAIFDCKGRSDEKPLIRLIAKPHHLELFTRTKVPEELLALWPGAITFIVKGVSGESVGYRCPGDEWLRKVIDYTGYAIFSTSVNKSGTPALTKISDIIAGFKDSVDVIVDRGDSVSSSPSTVVDLTGEKPRIIRNGSVDVSSLLK